MTSLGDGLRCRFSAVRGQTPPWSLSVALVLPALLGDVEVAQEGQHQEYDTISAGQFSQHAPWHATLGKTERDLSLDEAGVLRQIDLSALTVFYSADWLVNNEVDPGTVKDELIGMVHHGKPVEMVLTQKFGGDTDEDLFRGLVTVRRALQRLSYGQPEVRYWDLSVTEWRDNQVKRRSHSSRREGRARGHRLPATIKLTATDTLSSLSQFYYGTPAGWRWIAEDNGVRNWGQSSPLVGMSRFRTGSTFRIPLQPSRQVALDVSHRVA